jgi:hypothetical protein
MWCLGPHEDLTPSLHQRHHTQQPRQLASPRLYLALLQQRQLEDLLGQGRQGRKGGGTGQQQAVKGCLPKGQVVRAQVKQQQGARGKGM